MRKSKLKYLYLLGIIALLSSTTSYSQINFSLQGGVSSTNMMSFYDAEDVDEEDLSPSYFKTGYNIGFLFSSQVADIAPHLKGLVFGGINIENKGYIYDYYRYTYTWGQRTGTELMGQNAFSIDYLSIPAYFQTRYCLKKSHVFINLGGYVSHTLDAKTKAIGDYKQELIDNGESTTKDVSFGYDGNNTIKPIDSGIIIGFGGGYKQFSTSLNMQLGLLNLIPVEPSNYKVSNFALSLWFCYQISRS